MRHVMKVIGGFAAILLSAGLAMASGVEVKGPHICCKQCVTVVGKILEKVDGVSDVSADAKTKTVKFTAKDSAAAKAGFRALLNGGFFGTATEDGKEIVLDLPANKKGDTVKAITVKDVHVCCGQCQTAVKKAFESATVTFEGTGAQRTVRIEGAGLERSAVLATLRKAGFNGKIE
jgi:copper chaperone CopZ/predicted nucleic acid-binding Zn ribbon protein